MSAAQCAGKDDVITMKAEDSGDTVSFMFETPLQVPCTDHFLVFAASRGLRGT